MINKHASAKWNGTLKEGKGEISTESGVLQNQPYGFNHRFEGEKGTNPEELIAAAHSSCFTMALSMILEKNGIDPTGRDLQTKCIVTLDKEGEGFAVKKSKLIFETSLNGADQATFEQSLQQAKEGCPISKLLDTEIELEIGFKDGKKSKAA
jgi:osmotically inducible protein OsmC